MRSFVKLGGLLAVLASCFLSLSFAAAGSPSPWPFMTIRQTGVSATAPEKFKEIIAASARHPGSVDEYWLCFSAGPSLANAQAKLNLWKPLLPLLESAHIVAGSQQGVTLPTHAERLGFIDAVEKVAALPVRIERAHPLYVFPRVDAEGRVRSVSLFNGSIGRCLPTEVVIRRLVSATVSWLRPGEAPRPLAAEPCGDGLKVKIPGLPGAHVGTLVF